MKIGDCFIMTSDFHKLDLGLIFIGETKTYFYFTPLNFSYHRFDNTSSSIFDGKIQTNTVFSGANLDEVTGIFAIHESKRKPSFLTKYCKDNKPFINLNLNVNKIVLGQGTQSFDEIIIGGGTNFPPTKEMFDKFNIQSLTKYHSRQESDRKSVV